MKLYYSPAVSSLMIRILMHEIGIKADFEAVDLTTKKTNSGKDFLSINAKGMVPALELDNKEILTENVIIQQYLVDHYKANHLLPAVGNFERYRILEWLNFALTELHRNIVPFFNPNIPEEVKKNVFIATLKNRLTYLSKELGNHHYLMGDDFCLADIYAYYALFGAIYIGIDIKEWPNLNDYYERVKSRKSVQQALNEEGLQ